MSLVTTSGGHMRQLLALSTEMMIGHIALSVLLCLTVSPKTPTHIYKLTLQTKLSVCSA